MYIFLLPLLIGFAFAGASAFTSSYSRWWGERLGKLVTSLLRNMLGIPLYMYGLWLAWHAGQAWLLPSGITGQGIGWLLIVSGSIPVIVGHWQLGLPTHLPSVRDRLLEHGLYAHVRHPIYAGGLLIFAGQALLNPTLSWLLACVLSGVFFSVMSRLEEIDLLQRMPAYREYMARVPRFIPRTWGHWAWLCPSLGLVMAAGVFYWWGLSLWTAILAALMLACPAIVLWGMIKLRRYPQMPLDQPAETTCCQSKEQEGEHHER